MMNVQVQANHAVRIMALPTSSGGPPQVLAENEERNADAHNIADLINGCETSWSALVKKCLGLPQPWQSLAESQEAKRPRGQGAKERQSRMAFLGTRGLTRRHSLASRYPNNARGVCSGQRLCLIGLEMA